MGGDGRFFGVGVVCGWLFQGSCNGLVGLSGVLVFRCLIPVVGSVDHDTLLFLYTCCGVVFSEIRR